MIKNQSITDQLEEQCLCMLTQANLDNEVGMIANIDIVHVHRYKCIKNLYLCSNIIQFLPIVTLYPIKQLG